MTHYISSICCYLIVLPLPCGVVVSSQASFNDRMSAPQALILSTSSNRSLVERLSLVRASSCQSRFWSAVEQRAYPITIVQKNKNNRLFVSCFSDKYLYE